MTEHKLRYFHGTVKVEGTDRKNLLEMTGWDISVKYTANYLIVYTNRDKSHAAYPRELVRSVIVEVDHSDDDDRDM